MAISGKAIGIGAVVAIAAVLVAKKIGGQSAPIAGQGSGKVESSAIDAMRAIARRTPAPGSVELSRQMQAAMRAQDPYEVQRLVDINEGRRR